MIMREFTATASSRHPDNLDGIRLEEVDPPPRTGLALGLRASFAVVLRAEVTVITVVCISASHSGRLVRRFAETHVRTCCAIFVLLQSRRFTVSRARIRSQFPFRSHAWGFYGRGFRETTFVQRLLIAV